MAQRIKGQDVSVILTVNGVPQATLADVRSFEVSSQLEILREGYLGETTDRRDDIFRGVKGKIEFHFETPDIFTLTQTLIQRARQRSPGVKVNVKATLQFPNGTQKLVMVPDVYFGEIPVNFGSRSDYGMATLDFEASDIQFL